MPSVRCEHGRSGVEIAAPNVISGAEHTVALLLALAPLIPQADRSLPERKR